MKKGKSFILGGLSVIAFVIFTILLLFSYTNTGVNITYDEEIPLIIKDNFLLNVAILIVIILLFYSLHKVINKFYKKININILLILTTLIITSSSLIWIFSSNTYPQADSYACTYFAHYFNDGNYFGLNKGEYCSIHQHQLGLIFIIQILFKLFGDGNYKAFQIMNAISLGILVISGDMIIRNLHFDADKKRCEIYYLALMLFCIPLYIYTDFVYGDMLTITFMFLTLWMLLAYLNRHKWCNLLLCIVCGFVACFARRNTLIFIIACAIILAIKLLLEKDKYVLLSLLSVILAAILSVVVPNTIYGSHIPEDAFDMPSTLYIAMGLQGDVGWYNSYNYETYKYLNFDPIEANNWAKANIEQSLVNFSNDKDKAFAFFKNKINIQWNVPMFQCLNMNHEFNGSPGRLAALVYDGFLNNVINIIANCHHLFIYSSCFIFLIYSFKNRGILHLEDYILMVFIVGGFLFSIIWEAKSRYILPYYVAMIPYAAIMVDLFINKLVKFNNK